MVQFTDRVAAGRELAPHLEYLRGHDIVVLGLPRGGVPVAYEVAEALGAPLDVIVVHRLDVPFDRVFAMGAIGEEGTEIVDLETVSRVGVTDDELRSAENTERRNLEQRVARLRHGVARVSLTGRTAVIVDDGVATGATAQIAIEVARRLGAARVVLAVPVISPRALEELVGADDIVYLHAPADFWSVGRHYTDFTAITDGQVAELLDQAGRR